MARIRTVKPEFWSDEKLASVSRDARLLFVALFNMAEDHGVARGNPAYVRSQAFPYDDDVTPAAVAGWLTELERAGVVRRFTKEKEAFLFIVNFGRHQKIDKPSRATLPEPPAVFEELSSSGFDEPSPSPPGALAEPSPSPREKSPLERKGKEGKGKEVEGSGREQTLPPPQSPPVPMLVEAPTTPPEGWLGEDFWSWAQHCRQQSQLVPERPPRIEKLSAWWSAVRSVVKDVGALQEGFYRFGDDRHWQGADPPLPFAAFMKQWEKYMPQGALHAAS